MPPVPEKPTVLEEPNEPDEQNLTAAIFGRIPLYLSSPASIQTNLAVSSPGDVYEDEGDRIAEQLSTE